jgi:hypothetical protein
MVDGVPQTKISHDETHKRGWEDQGGYLIYTLDLKRFIYGETNTEYDPLSGYPVIQDPSTIKPGDPQAYTPFWLQYEDEASIKGDRIILEKYFPMEKQRDDHPSLPTYASYEYDLKVDIERDQETGKLNKVNINYTGYNASGEKEYVLNGEYFYNKEGELEKMNEVTEGEMPNYYPWHDVIYRNMNEADPNADNKLLEADQVKFDVTASERLKNAEAENAKNNEGREAIEESSVNKIITENDRTLSRKQAWMSRQRQAVEDMKTAWDVKPVNKNTVYKPIVDPAMKDSQSENI